MPVPSCTPAVTPCQKLPPPPPERPPPHAMAEAAVAGLLVRWALGAARRPIFSSPVPAARVRLSSAASAASARLYGQLP